MGSIRSSRSLGGATLAVAIGIWGLAIPQPGAAQVTVSGQAEPAAIPARAARVADPDRIEPAAVARWRDLGAGLSIVPPAGWAQAPATSLDRAGDEDIYEVARFQLRVGDPALYAQPLPVTSGLLADAGAVLSIGLVREESDLLGIARGSLDPDDIFHVPGATAVDSETSYDGIVTFSRIVVTRDTHRSAVLRAFVPAADRDALVGGIRAAFASATVDAEGPAGPRYVAPAPPAPPPAPAPEVTAQAVIVDDPSQGIRADILARARDLLGTPYVWGGNAAGRAMDCSAYVSAAWGTSRWSTDSIWAVAAPIGKEDLRPGDAMDLETWRDPSGYGHIRLFDAWANEAHTLVWVYEETPPRAIHRVIAYDGTYRPIRLAGLSNSGAAPLVPAPAAQPAPRFDPAPRPRPAATPQPRTAGPAVRPTPRPTSSPRPAPALTRPPVVTPRPTAAPTPSASARAVVGQATARPRATPRPTHR